MGQPPHGPVPHRRHARGDHVRAAPPDGDLGLIAQATSGSFCPSPSPSAFASLRSTYVSIPLEQTANHELQSVVVVGDSTACTLLPGLQAVGPSYGMRFENGAVIGCGVVSGVIAPFYVDGHNVVAYTTLCQGQANQAETPAIEHYHPSLILWGSTDERSSIVVNTAHGSKVLASGSPEWKSVMLQRMNTRVKKFLATGARVVLTLAPPAVHPAVHTVDSDDENYAQMNALLKKVAATAPAPSRRCRPLAPGVSCSVRPAQASCRPSTLIRHRSRRPCDRWQPLPSERIALGGAVVGAPDRCRRQEASLEASAVEEKLMGYPGLHRQRWILDDQG